MGQVFIGDESAQLAQGGQYVALHRGTAGGLQAGTVIGGDVVAQPLEGCVKRAGLHVGRQLRVNLRQRAFQHRPWRHITECHAALQVGNVLVHAARHGGQAFEQLLDMFGANHRHHTQQVGKPGLCAAQGADAHHLVALEGFQPQATLNPVDEHGARHAISRHQRIRRNRSRSDQLRLQAQQVALPGLR